MKIVMLFFIVASMLTTHMNGQGKKENAMSSIYDFTVKTIDGKDRSLAEYKGKVVMIVNVASFCGYTPQYKQLEAIYKKYSDKGFVVLGFPANNFGKQEPGSDADIATFCERNYGVSFDLFSKISVKGSDIHPLYNYLTTETEFKGDIGWNFTKFLIDKNGKVVDRFKSSVKPDDKAVLASIEALLEQK